MSAYLFRKGLSFLCSLFLVASLTFFLMKMAPGDPFSEEQTLRLDVQEKLHQQHGLDRSWFLQYRDYLQGLLCGRLGESLKYPGRNVQSIIQETFPVSARLGLQALSIALLFGIGLGTCAAYYAHQWQDSSILAATAAGLSIPSFILAALLQFAFAIYCPLLPLARWGTFAHTLLPSLALAAAPTAFITRLTRSGLLEALQSDYIKLAKAKGLPKHYWLWHHALRNALLPVLTYMGPLFTNVLTGSFVVEKLFSIPGLGQWLVHSVANRDYPLIMGLTLFYSLLLLSAVFLIDLLYALCDPRIRLVDSGYNL